MLKSGKWNIETAMTKCWNWKCGMLVFFFLGTTATWRPRDVVHAHAAVARQRPTTAACGYGEQGQQRQRCGLRIAARTARGSTTACSRQWAIARGHERRNLGASGLGREREEGREEIHRVWVGSNGGEVMHESQTLEVERASHLLENG